MTEFNCKSKVFSGPTSAQSFGETPLGQVLLSSLSRSPGKILQIDEGGVSLSCKDVSEQAISIAAFLMKSGLRFADVIGFCGKNTVHLLPAVIGCILLGLPISPIDSSLEEDGIVKIYKQTKPKLIFCDHDQVDKFANVLRSLESNIQIITLTEKAEGFLSIREILTAESTADVDIPKSFGVPPDRICVAIMGSSGSTGEPKLALISHAQLTNPEINLPSASNPSPADNFQFNYYTLFWISGLACMIDTVLNLRTRLITKKSFSIEHCVEMVKRFKPTSVAMSPSHVASLGEHLRENSIFLDSILFITTGGWFTSMQSIETIESMLPNGRVLTLYGMTETAAGVSLTEVKGPRTNSVGKLTTNSQVKVLLSDDTFGSIGDTGEILIKRPFHIIGYLNNEKTTKDFIDDEGWMHTGDIGYFDQDLNLNIVGRKKFLIRCLNRLVNPMEIEAIISELDGVFKVCVVAVPDNEAYESPCAIIERSLTGFADESDVIRAVSHLENFKQLKSGVFFVDQLPLTRTGKLDRNAVEKLALQLTKQS
jgi:4-coumarate--CoA ligase